MDRITALERLIEPTVEGLDYDLVRVRFDGRTLQVMAERKDRAEMTVEDCALLSRNLSAVLDIEDPIPGEYSLEVSSPGIDRPLIRLADYERFAGHEARVETDATIDGRKRFRGRIGGVDGGNVKMSVGDADYAIPIERIARAKLVLTDELIAESLGKSDG